MTPPKKTSRIKHEQNITEPSAEFGQNACADLCGVTPLLRRPARHVRQELPQDFSYGFSITAAHPPHAEKPRSLGLNARTTPPPPVLGSASSVQRSARRAALGGPQPTARNERKRTRRGGSESQPRCQHGGPGWPQKMRPPADYTITLEEKHK